MFKRLFSLPLDANNSAFIFGPRGTGKTHWIEYFLRDVEHIYFDLLDSSTYRTFQANPEAIQAHIPDNYQGWIVIDEVQRVPELLNEVHRAIEHNKQRFILTGSSARQLRKKGTNLLAGRALRYHMHPLTIQELGDAFDLEHALTLGMLPETYAHDQPERYLASYIETYLREEVLQEGLTRNISAFARFVEIASYSQGSSINASEIAREVSIDRKVIENYFSILTDLLLCHMVPPFTKRAKRKLMQKDRFYYFDVGIYHQLRPKGILDSTSEIGGAALETLFLQSLLAIIDYNNLSAKVYYWRTISGIEVDFIVYGDDILAAFEIKHTKSITPSLTKGLKQFKKDYPMCQSYLIYQGKEKQYLSDNITALPIAEALRTLPNILSGDKKNNQALFEAK